MNTTGHAAAERFGARPLACVNQVSLVAAAVLLALGTFAAAPLHAAAEAQKPAVAFHPSQAQVAGLQIEAVRSHRFADRVEADATIAANDDASTPVFSPFSGRVMRVVAHLGDRVSRGAPLMIVEASEIVQGLSDLRAALAALSTARSQLELAGTTEQRQHDLYLSQAGAFKDWQQAQSDLIGAGNAVQTADNALASARSRLRLLGKTDAELDVLEQRPEAGAASAGADAAASAQAPVRAPIDGVVVQRQVGVGEYITSVTSGASNPVFTIGDLSRVWVVANVRESDAALVAAGQSALVRVPALSQQPMRMRIDWVAASLDPATRRLAARGEIDNRNGALRPMMQAVVSIDAGHEAVAPSVPSSAIVFDGARAHVWVAAGDGSVVLRAVRPGRSDGGLVEIVDGLAAGERVVTRGTLFLDQAAEGAP